VNRKNYYIVGSILMIFGVYSLMTGLTLATVIIDSLGPPTPVTITVIGSIPEHGAIYNRTPATLQISVIANVPISRIYYVDNFGLVNLTLIEGTDSTGVWYSTNPTDSNLAGKYGFIFTIVSNITATHKGIYEISVTSVDDGSQVTGGGGGGGTTTSDILPVPDPENPDPIITSLTTKESNILKGDYLFGGTITMLGALTIVYGKVKEKE